MTLLSGSTAKIEWTFDDKITDVIFRVWSFTSTDGTFKSRTLATIRRNDSAITRTNFPVVEVEKSGTLVLKNVDRRYDGKYKFSVTADFYSESEVVVIIIGKFI